MDKIYVVPSAGLLVRDPVTKEVIPEGGKLVQKSSFWIRREKDGDVAILPKGPLPGAKAVLAKMKVADAQPEPAAPIERKEKK